MGVALAVADAHPERWVRYSLVGESWQQVRNRFNLNTYRIRQAGYAYNVAWYVHRNPKETGHHIHAHQWGDFIPQSELQNIGRSVGFGFPDIRAWHERSKLGTGYGMREMLGTAYGSRDMRGAGMHQYLDTNGGRIVHTTRGFFRRWDGLEAGTLKAAVKSAYRARLGDSAGEWIVEVGTCGDEANG